MKKRTLGIVLCVSLLLLCGCKEETKDFKIGDYEETINNDDFKYNGSIKSRSISNDNEAKEYAEALWLDVFDKSVKNEKPYVVYRDGENEAWLVHGTLEKNTIGGTAWIIFKSNGEILAVWHEK